MNIKRFIGPMLFLRESALLYPTIEPDREQNTYISKSKNSLNLMSNSKICMTIRSTRNKSYVCHSVLGQNIVPFRILLIYH